MSRNMVSNILFKINLNNIIYIILVMDLNKELIKLLNQAINIKYHYDTNKYKRVYTNEYYLNWNMFFCQGLFQFNKYLYNKILSHFKSSRL